MDKIWDDWKADMKKNQLPEFVKLEDLPGDEDDNVGDGGGKMGGDAEEEDADAQPPLLVTSKDRAKNIKKHVKSVLGAKHKEGPITVEETADYVLHEMERYTAFGFLKKTILITMANTMDRNDVGRLREIFLKADTNDSGTITLQELIGAFKKVSPDTEDKRVEELFIGIDRDKSGHIHYAEFLAALAESHGLVTLNRLTEAFDRIDTDGKGYITHDDLKSILGKDYDKVTVDKMIEEGDFKKNNKIDYEELLQLMFDDPVKGDKIAGSVFTPISPDDRSVES